HVRTPRVLADPDNLDDLVLARIDFRDDAEVGIRRVEPPPVVRDLRNVDPLDVAEILLRIELGDARHVADLDLLEQLVPADVDDADPVRTVVADVSLRPVWREDRV